MIIVIPRENPTQRYLQEMNLKYKDRRLLKVKKEKEMPSNAKYKNTAISVFISSKGDYRTRSILRVKESS